MRMMLAVVLAACGLAVVPGPPAGAVPEFCPPACDTIPDSAWMVSTAIPLYPVYRWPGLAGLAVTATAPRFAFEEACASPPVIGDPREYAVAAAARVPNPPNEWQLQAQVVHWRGPTSQGGPTATQTFEQAKARLRTCQLTAPFVSPSITTDAPDRLAAVISVAGQRVMRQYLLAHPDSSSIVELAMWSTLPTHVPWSPVPDAQVFEAMTAPLCQAYVGSCR
ncbi:ATPase [Mycolicibacterium holsaticum]|uniref:ATPase n=1 Tax=Mycolicibacterium holsaticum TaxID=152142 RepID=A0A1E3R347_9MYCO|nr:ATPase [Mycolicibacterium holsaticum]ODQ84336.1 ATPase [Mycolicibacterium holsaticum]QZA13324.1 ATPase [Mycolicibacterium holsaticum DSM 44478 = JCM 12374]UNC09208.1 ATPase [Mycolicibacterium holsaticum DSM 44478 = JCM 12374]